MGPRPRHARLWTPSFALLAGALGLAIFLVAYAFFDVLLQRRLSEHVSDRVGWPLVALGRNSLLVYFGSHLLSGLLLRRGADGAPSWAERIGGAVSWPFGAQVGFALLSLAAWWTVAAVPHRRRIYVRP